MRRWATRRRRCQRKVLLAHAQTLSPTPHASSSNLGPERSIISDAIQGDHGGQGLGFIAVAVGQDKGTLRIKSTKCKAVPDPVILGRQHRYSLEALRHMLSIFITIVWEIP